MEIRPIISALMRSKVSMILIGLQVALTLAIVCNALFIISKRLELMNRPSGMNETDTFWFGSNGFGQGYDAKAVQQTDLALLRHIPGVVAATTTNSVPMSDGGWGEGFESAAAPEKIHGGHDGVYRRCAGHQCLRYALDRRTRLQAGGNRGN